MSTRIKWESRSLSASETVRAAGRQELEKTVAQLVSSWSIRAAVLAGLFATNGQFGDSHGRQGSGVDVEKGIEIQFAAHRVGVEHVALENIQDLSMDSAVVTLRLTVRPERETKRVPISISSARSRRATPAGVKSRRRAASAIDPQSATAAKLSRNRVSMKTNGIF